MKPLCWAALPLNALASAESERAPFGLHSRGRLSPAQAEQMTSRFDRELQRIETASAA